MATGGKPTEEDIAAFLSNGISLMQSEETRKLLKEVPKPGDKLIELQRAGWDPLGVDRDIGCAQLAQIDKLYPSNAALRAQRIDFVMAAQTSFLRALEDKRPAKLERKKPMPRETIIEFFNACNTKMDMPETREILRKHVEDKHQAPNQVIIEMQRDMLEVMGFERDHGCAMLSRIGQDYPRDQELHQRFEMWKQKAQATFMQVMNMHQMGGGEMPKQPFAMSPEMAELQQRAKAELEKMSQDERKELVERLQRKVQVFSNLPAEGKAKYMKGLSDADKMEFAKAQVHLLSIMQEQWRRQQQQQAGSASSGAAPSAPVKATAELPQQQQMM